MVLWDATEEVMDDVKVSNAVHQVLSSKAEVAVDGGRGATEESPGLWLVFGDVGVSVVEVGDGDDPVVDPHVRLTIESEDHGPADQGADVPDSGENEADADV